MSKHTPTPWAVHLGDTVTTEDMGTPIATGHVNAEFNVPFIVRACNAHEQLVSALEDMMDWARAVSDEYIDGGDLREDYRQALSDARDALGTARGAP